FLLTEDMSRPMALVDKWTIVNAIVFIVEIIAVVLVFRHNKNNIAVNNNAMDPNSSTVPSSTHK
ncbi:MAG: hypothetical protein FWD52_04045, partial [Candidatus Bathyarchaeota archaeon]|nr:hypothetical protein [Candidatus Termiticorpusculum sp.]